MVKAYDPGGSDFEPPPPGLQAAVCCDVIDMGMMPGYKPEDPPAHTIRIVWMLASRMDDGRPFITSMLCTVSMHEKSNLRKLLESWRGCSYSAEESEKLRTEGFETEGLVGQPCAINVVHEPKGDKVYGNPGSVSTCPEALLDQVPLIPPDYVRHKDRPQEGAASGAAPTPTHQPAPSPQPAPVPQQAPVGGPAGDEPPHPAETGDAPPF